MNVVEKEILAAATEVAPSNPVVEVANAVVDTAANPSSANILADLELLISLIRRFKANHPHLLAEIKAHL